MLAILVRRFTQTTVGLQRVESDLASARLVQRSLLPQQMPYIAGYSVEVRSIACYAVGGDYLDIVPMPSGEIMIVLADVAGKGLSSAMVGCSFRSAFRAMVNSGIPLVEIATRMNLLHYNEGQQSRNRYVTAILLQFDPASNQIQVVNAGHNPAFLISGTGPESVQRIGASGIPIGMLPASTYHQENYSLLPGAKLLLYTDGLTEVYRRNEEFGEARLLQSFLDCKSVSAQGVLDSLWSMLDDFTDKDDQADDMSAIVLLREA
jgi:serine phosphatase RsbU (regulator of sigma subunit)